MDKETMVQDQRRDTVQEKTKRIKEKRPIHLQVEHGHTQQRQIETGVRKVERSPIDYRFDG